MWESPLLTRRLGTSCRAVSTVAAEFFTCTDASRCAFRVSARACKLACPGLYRGVATCNPRMRPRTHVERERRPARHRGRPGTGGMAQGRRGTGGSAKNRAAHMKGERGERQRRHRNEGGGICRRRPRAEEALRLAAAAVPIDSMRGRIGRWNGRTDTRWMATTARRMRGCSQSIGAQGAGLRG